MTKRHLFLLGALIPALLSAQAHGQTAADGGQVGQAPIDSTARCATGRSLPAVPRNCGFLNTAIDIANNPWAYINPNGGCDFNLSLPGLPNFGSVFDDMRNMLGGGACEAINQVTQDKLGNIVGKANSIIPGGGVNVGVRPTTGYEPAPGTGNLRIGTIPTAPTPPAAKPATVPSGSTGGSLLYR